MNLSNSIRTIKTVITANSPVLLVGTAVAGVVTTGILSAKGGYKARGIVDEERARRRAQLDSDSAKAVKEYQELMAAGADLTVQEKFQLTWLCYAAPAVTGASTIASVVGVHTIHTKRHAALAGLYAVTSGKLDDYREKAEELLGSKKVQQLNDTLAQDAVDSDAPFENHEVIITGQGAELCRDDFSGRYFYGSVATVEKAIGTINIQLVESGDASLNNYYDLIGLDPIPLGDSYGWSGTKLEPRFGSATTPDGRACITVWFHKEPKPELGISR